MTAEPEEGAFKKAQPQREHRWLDRLLGDWTVEADLPGENGAPGVKVSGTEHFRSIEGLWVVGEGRHEGHPEGIGITLMTLGYDPAKERFVGTWIGSMMTQLWVYEGSLDAAERVLTLDCEGPSMDGKGTARYQDIIEFVSDEHRLLRSQFQGEDGEWQEFMVTHYRRAR